LTFLGDGLVHVKCGGERSGIGGDDAGEEKKRKLGARANREKVSENRGRLERLERVTGTGTIYKTRKKR